MSRSHHTGHGRCGACGDAGANRRARETAWHRADDRETGDPWDALLITEVDETYVYDVHQHWLAAHGDRK